MYMAPGRFDVCSDGLRLDSETVGRRRHGWTMLSTSGFLTLLVTLMCVLPDTAPCPLLLACHHGIKTVFCRITCHTHDGRSSET